MDEAPEEQELADEAESPAEETGDGDNAEEGQMEPAKADTPTVDADEEKRRAEHEAAEAKRKAEWEAKQAEKKKALQEQMDRLAAIDVYKRQVSMRSRTSIPLRAERSKGHENSW